MSSRSLQLFTQMLCKSNISTLLHGAIFNADLLFLRDLNKKLIELGKHENQQES